MQHSSNNNVNAFLTLDRYLASRFKGIRHFLALGGILVAIIGAAMIYGLPTERKIPRLMFVPSQLDDLVTEY